MTNKDAIRVLKAIKEHPSLGVYLPDEYEALDLAIKALEERPHGKWLIHQTGLLLREECNQCHAQVGTIGLNYCPNCGADMREEADNDKLA